MNEKRTPILEEEPKHKKKSKASGRKRADHKHEYKTVLLIHYYDSPITGKRHEYPSATKICTVCGRVGYIDETQYELVRAGGTVSKPYFERKIKNPDSLEKWICEDLFSKRASRVLFEFTQEVSDVS